MEDSHIVNLLEDGRSDEAFNLIVQTYKERLYWHIRRMSVSHDDTDDLLQNIFVKIWSGLPSFRRESRLYTWIYRIATNEVITWLNKEKIRTLLSFSSPAETLASRVESDPYFNGDRLQKELLKAIARLPEKQRIVFCMRYFDETSYEDLSAILKTSQGALKASYHHAYNKVRQYLSGLDI